MNTLWCFGDSFTFGHGCREDCPAKLGYYESYKKDGDDIWPNLLSKKLNMNVINLGKNGASNDWIFDTIIENFNNIKENDAISINKTFPQRFDVEDKNMHILRPVHAELPETIIDGDWVEYLSNTSNGLYDSVEQFETLLNFTLYYSNSILIKERQDKRFDFIHNLLKQTTNKIVVWRTNEGIADIRLERIFQHTNGKINDGHFSFESHKNFANILFKLLENGKTIY